jgi:hypothetical protein
VIVDRPCELQVSEFVPEYLAEHLTGRDAAGDPNLAGRLTGHAFCGPIGILGADLAICVEVHDLASEAR